MNEIISKFFDNNSFHSKKKLSLTTLTTQTNKKVPGTFFEKWNKTEEKQKEIERMSAGLFKDLNSFEIRQSESGKEFFFLSISNSLDFVQ